jgi:hypothetical protein
MNAETWVLLTVIVLGAVFLYFRRRDDVRHRAELAERNVATVKGAEAKLTPPDPDVSVTEADEPKAFPFGREAPPGGPPLPARLSLDIPEKRPDPPAMPKLLKGPVSFKVEAGGKQYECRMVQDHYGIAGDCDALDIHVREDKVEKVQAILTHAVETIGGGAKSLEDARASNVRRRLACTPADIDASVVLKKIAEGDWLCIFPGLVVTYGRTKEEAMARAQSGILQRLAVTLRTMPTPMDDADFAHVLGQFVVPQMEGAFERQKEPVALADVTTGEAPGSTSPAASLPAAPAAG